MALPGMVVALFLFPLYHAPVERPFWSQVSDHYFYVLYSFVAVGIVSIFAWDLLFPDLLDLFVLSPLPIAGRRLFLARLAAACLFLALFLFGANALGFIFFPALSDAPGLARHLFAHLVAVMGSGVFVAAFFLSLQGILVALLGERLFRAISPFLQGLAMMLLLTIFLLFPVSSRFLEALTHLRSLFSAVLVFGNIREASGRIIIPAGFQPAREDGLPGNRRCGCHGDPFLSRCLSTQNALPGRGIR